jgi:choline dehydrogenase-like flavoprotein
VRELAPTPRAPGRQPASVFARHARPLDPVGYFQLTQRNGRRWSTADGYLHSALGRRNLTVETGAVVTHILIQGNRAVGMRYREQGTEREVRVSREVILSGGAIKTPQLLMLSGIGSRDHLRLHGIDTIVDAPGVGQNLQDHPMCLPEWATPMVPSLVEGAARENLALWQTEGLPMPAPNRDMTIPNRRAVALIVAAIDVKSRGRAGLQSADPHQAPAIDPAYFADSTELDLLVAGVRHARKIAAHLPLASLTDGEIAPGATVNDQDDEHLRDWIRRHRGHDVSRHQHMCDGQRGRRRVRSRVARARRGQPACRRRLNHAEGATRKYQRTDNFRRRASRRLDPRRGATPFSRSGRGGRTRRGLVGHLA